MKTALELFRSGRDTAEIARILRIPEPMALGLITVQRSIEMGKPNPYRGALRNCSARRRKPSLIAYAGR